MKGQHAGLRTGGSRALAAALALASLASATGFPAPAARAAGRASWTPIERVEGDTPVVVSVREHPRVYFEVTAADPLEISVVGPTRVRIVTRAEIARGAALPVSYGLKVLTGGKTLGESKTESSPADSVERRDGKGVLCKSRTLLVSVPAGSHRLAIGVTGVPAVLVRILVASPPAGAGAAMVSLAPLDAARGVTVAEGERLIPYYTTRRGAPVRFRIVGPTAVEVLSRLDYDKTMRGSQHYRLALRVDGAAARETGFTTTKAATAVYTDRRNRIPSKIDRVVLTLAGGTHDVTVELLSPKGGAAQIHARIPQPSVGNEE